jgi:predicted Fe-Mo cluster-binding NifX family protein
MKVAIPVVDGLLAPRLGGIEELSIVEVDLDTREADSARRAEVRGRGPEQMIEWLQTNGVDLVILAAGDQNDIGRLSAEGFSVKVGPVGESPRNLVKAFLRDEL